MRMLQSHTTLKASCAGSHLPCLQHHCIACRMPIISLKTDHKAVSVYCLLMRQHPSQLTMLTAELLLSLNWALRPHYSSKPCMKRADCPVEGHLNCHVDVRSRILLHRRSPPASICTQLPLTCTKAAQVTYESGLAEPNLISAPSNSRGFMSFSVGIEMRSTNKLCTRSDCLACHAAKATAAAQKFAECVEALHQRLKDHQQQHPLSRLEKLQKV